MTPKTLVLLTSILFSSIALAQTMPITPYPWQPVPYLANLLTLDGKEIYGGAGNNCVMTDFNTPVQGYRVSGSTGGLLTHTNEPTTDVQSVANRLINYFGDDWKLNHDVTIIVIDDFSLPGDMGFTHGELVFSHINKIIAATGYFPDDPNSSLEQVVWVKNGHTLTVIAQNIGDDTSLIQTEAALNAISEFGSWDFNVFNLSWVIIPCTTLEDFQTLINTSNVTLHFENYVQALRDTNIRASTISKDTSFTQVYQAIFYPVENDPLLKVLTNPEVNAKIVASAGNFSLPFELFPAALNTVEGVAAFYDTGYRAHFSNYGQYHEVGAWFSFDHSEHHDFNFNIPDDFYYGGTSYSAPIGSIWRALEIGSQ